MSLFIVLLGLPGAGKGTQAKIISERMHLEHISSGELFRENFRKQTELGKKAREYINRGELVPDEVTIAMVKDRLCRGDCEKGALLDGFPRNVEQAIALDKILAEKNKKVIGVPYLSVPPEVLVDRLGGRWSCRDNGHIFHEVYKPPKMKGVCDLDGSDLYQREDDRPDIVRTRINVYEEQTAPLVDYYTQKGLLMEFDGTKSIYDVSIDMMTYVDNLLLGLNLK